MPKWAKADPDTTKTAAIANAITCFVFIFSSLFVFFGEAKKSPKKKPRAAAPPWRLAFVA
jgi:hypothetical protein